uniref:interleukin-12 subunit alpha n=1 Tax=Scatophagus argus TaxID=75038 RepID=UPI001ED7F422|nr:interleukin-12 subunit alpha [Scatophagus argus]
MPLVKLYLLLRPYFLLLLTDLSCALLLLLLTCPLWKVSQSLPVMSKGPMADSCVLYAQTLLKNVTEKLAQNDLFSGIDCTKQSVELNVKTNTAFACAPKESACSEIVKTEFDQDLCLTNIGEDLRHYYQFLAAQPDPDNLIRPSILLSLKELMENCFAWSLPTDSEEAAADRPSTYDERLSLCKVLKGFQIRTVTINRVISYMNSGEHTK